MHDSTIALTRVLRTPSLVPPASAPSANPAAHWRQALPIAAWPATDVARAAHRGRPGAAAAHHRSRGHAFHVASAGGTELVCDLHLGDRSRTTGRPVRRLCRSCRTARTSPWAWCRSGSSSRSSAPPSGALRSGLRGGARGCLKTPAASFSALPSRRLASIGSRPGSLPRMPAATRRCGKLGAVAEGLLRRALRTSDGHYPRPDPLGMARRRVAA